MRIILKSLTLVAFLGSSYLFAGADNAKSGQPSMRFDTCEARIKGWRGSTYRTWEIVGYSSYYNITSVIYSSGLPDSLDARVLLESKARSLEANGTCPHVDRNF